MMADYRNFNWSYLSQSSSIGTTIEPERSRLQCDTAVIVYGSVAASSSSGECVVERPAVVAAAVGVVVVVVVLVAVVAVTEDVPQWHMAHYILHITWHPSQNMGHL
jgi:hypothetical protein